MNLVPLFEEALEFQDYNGTVLSDGKVAVYYIGRTRLADIYEDVAAEYPAENPRILNNLGMGPVYVNPAFDYEMVVFDAYGSELFSVKKYLASKGEHSTANVVVTPSESIAVSAWTVGDVQVYMPYLTGQLGKVYAGIEPIVVNNVEDKISANHVPLGVQDPLYFVQDDEEGCIIGCSAQTEIPVELSGKWDNASDAVIANSAQWSENTTYEAGSYIDIDNNTISVTGLSPLPADTASTGLVAQVSADITAMIPDTSDMATQTWVNEQGFLTAHQDISNKLDTTAFSTVSGDFLTAIPSEYVTENTLQSGLSSKLDSTAFSTVSGDFLTAIPEGYATEDWVTAQGYLTAHQSLDGLMSASLLEQSGGLITGYNGTAFAGQGGGVTGDYELSAGSGISIVDYPLEQKTVISVTAQGGNPEVEQAVIDNSATWDSVTAKADSTAIPSLDGYATEDWVTAQGYLTAETDWSDTITAASANAYAEATAAIPTGLATTGDLANVSADITAQIPTDLFTKASADTLYYPLESNPAGYLTAHQDLSDYQTTAGMTAYLTTGDSAEFMTTAERSDYIPTGVSSEFYTTANTANYISEVPDTYLQNTDLSTEDGKVTAISGIPLSAGGDVPEGVMVESGLEYNAQGYISGYAGSAITGEATIYTDSATMTGQGTVSEPFGVKSTDLFVQEPLYTGTSGNSAYIGWNNETVLWTTANSIMVDNSTKMQITLAEPASNFETLRIVCSNSYDEGETFKAPRRYWDVEIPDETTLYRFGIDLKSPNGLDNLYEDMCHCQYINQGFSAFSGKRSNMTYTANAQNTNVTNRGPRIFEIRGINRKA